MYQNQTSGSSDSGDITPPTPPPRNRNLGPSSENRYADPQQYKPPTPVPRQKSNQVPMRDPIPLTLEVPENFRPVPIKRKSTNVELALGNELWYHGEMSQEKADQFFTMDVPTGSFLVRNWENLSFLELKMDTQIFKTSINETNRRYWLVDEQIKFNGVVEMINYYKSNPINNESSVRLLYPIMNARYWKMQFENKCLEILKHDDKMNETQNIHDQKECALEQKEMIAKAFEIGGRWFTEHITDNEQSRKAVESNIMDMKRMLDLLKAEKETLKASSDQLKLDRDDLKFELNNLKEKIQSEENHHTLLMTHKGEIIRNLKKFGVTETEMEELTDNSKVKFRSKYHLDRNNWFFPNYDREAAEKALKNTTPGTFLIRSSQRTQYAISISFNGTIDHILIEQHCGKYCFNKDFIGFETLDEFVAHYAVNSLEAHNAVLKICLAIPYGCKQNDHDRPRYYFI